MQIWPAIDLRGGKCVRLQQGDYQRETVFSDDPVAMAQSFAADQGAKYLHLVDLDGARDGKPTNHDVVRANRSRRSTCSANSAAASAIRRPSIALLDTGLTIGWCWARRR